MPEMPEVEAFKKYIETTSLHKMITNVAIADPKVIHGSTATVFKKVLIGNSFTKIERVGKMLKISLKTTGEKILMHFGLDGYLTYEKTDAHIPHAIVTFAFDNNHRLSWCSIRKFGGLVLLPEQRAEEEIHQLGPDAASIKQPTFLKLLTANSKKNIKAFLMDQALIAGIGNEYADEILFQAGIDPHHAIKDISEAARKTLYKQMHSVLQYATKLRLKEMGSAMGHRFFSKQDRALFKPSYLQAHRHVDMICPKNKNHTLKRATIAGRTTFYCPIDQK